MTGCMWLAGVEGLALHWEVGEDYGLADGGIDVREGGGRRWAGLRVGAVSPRLGGGLEGSEPHK